MIARTQLHRQVDFVRTDRAPFLDSDTLDEMSRNTRLIDASEASDATDTQISDYGGLHDARPGMVARAFDGGYDFDQCREQQLDDIERFGRVILYWVAYPLLSAVLILAYFNGWLS